jgi:hypothetical protein
MRSKYIEEIFEAKRKLMTDSFERKRAFVENEFNETMTICMKQIKEMISKGDITKTVYLMSEIAFLQKSEGEKLSFSLFK